MANLKILAFLAINLIVINVIAQNSKIYYNFPEKVETKLNEHITSYINIYKKIDTTFKIYLAISQFNDTTQILVTKFNIKGSPFNFILNNSNRYYKTQLKNEVLDIPIVFSTDYTLSEPLNKKESENGRQAITSIHLFQSGYLLGFIIKKNIASIVIDRYTVH